jgi:hypothetical protein
MQVDWTAPAETFPRLVMMLCLPVFRRPALAGLCISVGGLTESLVRSLITKFPIHFRVLLSRSRIGRKFLCCIFLVCYVSGS